MNRPRLLLALSLGCCACSLLAQVSPEQYAAAEALFKERRTDEARAAFAQLAKADPRHAGVHHYLGLIALRSDDPKSACDSFERATELAPANSEYHRHLGDAYGMQAMRAPVFSKLGLAKKCLRSYEKAVECDPTSIDARWSVMEFHKQAPGIVGGSLEKAYAQAEEIRRLDAVGGRWAKALLMLHESKGHLALELYAEEMARAEPSYAALYQFGRISQWSGQELARGQQALERCLTMTPGAWAGGHAEVYYALGKIHERREDREAARTAYRAALNLDPAHKPTLDALAKLG